MLRTVQLVSLLVLAIRLSAQGSSATPQPPADSLQRAAAAFAQGDWKASFDAYVALAKAYPQHPLSRFRVGVSLMELGRLAEAESNMRQAETLGVPPAQAAYRLAQLLAEQGKTEMAFKELDRAVTNRLPVLASALETDKHFASLRSQPHWAVAMDALDAVTRPCMHDARAREFDFWLGDWDVRAVGQPPVGPAARNTVTVEDNGCVIVEHWSAPSGSEGQSFNIFDRSYGVWRQTWVDNGGGQHDYRGSLKGGNMVYLGDTPAPNGQLGRVPTKLTFFHISADSVRQFSEISRDSGRTWQFNYDLMYVRRKHGAGSANIDALSDRQTRRFVTNHIVNNVQPIRRSCFVMRSSGTGAPPRSSVIRSPGS